MGKMGLILTYRAMEITSIKNEFPVFSFVLPLTYRSIRGVGNLDKNYELPQYLSAKYIQTYLSISKSTVYRMFDSGDLPTVQIGSNRRVKREDFIKWLKEKEVNHA